MGNLTVQMEKGCMCLWDLICCYYCMFLCTRCNWSSKWLCGFEHHFNMPSTACWRWHMWPKLHMTILNTVKVTHSGKAALHMQSQWGRYCMAQGGGMGSVIRHPHRRNTALTDRQQSLIARQVKELYLPQNDIMFQQCCFTKHPSLSVTYSQ